LNDPHAAAMWDCGLMAQFYGRYLNHTHCPYGTIAMFFLREAFEDGMRNSQLPIRN